MHVPQLVQEQFRVQRYTRRNEHGTPEGDGGNGTLAERPAAYPNRETTAPQPHLRELRVPR
ncbi:MAG TPA: hypothetical protein VFK39_14455 [Gemmatimonadaceae bacterium]|nr:hypothetical protein [Gemmatimonadaceae bacterium]